ncbi:hypothetical protein H4R19_004248, partial [Coemansia spiralis]
AWAARFPAHVRHMVSAPEHVADNNPFQRHLRIQASMAAVNPRVFVMPQAAATPDVPAEAFLPGRTVIVPHSRTMFDFEPKPALDDSQVRLLLTPDEMLAQQAPDAARPPAKDPEPVTGEAGLVVCPIGTGSSVPSLYRNVSANVVSVSAYGGMVLDCGESTVSLLKRFLGFPQRNVYNTRIGLSYTEFVASLKLLYISHMHADHHLGAVLLLREWAQLTRTLEPRPRLTIVGPARFWIWLEDYAGVEDLELDRIDFISCRDIQFSDAAATGKALPAGKHELNRTRVAKLKADLGLTDIATCNVIHCPWAYGVSFTHSSGWKLVYSGDTRPCANLITLGRAGGTPPTILLHEATLPDDLIQDAIAKRHSTSSEAVAMAVGMGAENLLMTHFSQRCLEHPRWKPAVVQSVKLSRYGYIAGGRNDGSGSGTPGSGLASPESAGTGANDAPLGDPGSTAVDTKAVKAALMRALGEPLSDESDGDDVTAKQRPFGGLNIAAAFDMTAFSPADIQHHRANVQQLRKALYKELTLFMAEAAAPSDADEAEDTQPAPKAKRPKSKGGK